MSNSMSARSVHSALSFALRACPSIKENESHAVIILDGASVRACDGYSHHSAALTSSITQNPIKVTRASVAGLVHLLGGMLKAAKETELECSVEWTGTAVAMTLGEERTKYELDPIYGGMDAKLWCLETPIPERAAVMMLPSVAMRNACWPDDCTSEIAWTAKVRAWITHRESSEDGSDTVLGVALVAAPGMRIELAQGELEFSTGGITNEVGPEEDMPEEPPEPAPKRERKAKHLKVVES